MIRPLPHIAGAANPAVEPDGTPKFDDAAQPGVPKTLRDPKRLAEARARAAKEDKMHYIRTDTGGGGDTNTKYGDSDGGGR